MTAAPLSVFRLPFAIHYPFSVIRVGYRLRAIGKGLVKGKGLPVNGTGGVIYGAF